MRIVAGELRGRRLNPPTNIQVRPTTDFAKESLFNILRNKIDFPMCSALDLFCGTGGISFEFVSRGIRQVTAVDINPKCIAFINKMKEQFKVDNLFTLRQDAFVYLGRSKMQFDVVFADPPYEMQNFDLVPELVLKSFVKPGGLFVLEHSKEHSYKDNPFFTEQRHYGKVNFSFFSVPLEQSITEINTEN
ncbi:MAG: RsmD family RNA methyltransferase [Bacteroidales bacterium]|nr:RsmD family RNA methyltransferase [Bacteroidales bacterium]